MPPISGYNSSDGFLKFIIDSFNSKDWKDNMTALNCLRQINKYHTEQIPNLIDNFLPQIMIQIQNPKTLIIKTVLIFL